LELNMRIIELRNEFDKTQTQLADDLDISRSTIAMIESGERKPGYDLLLKIADYFNVSTDYLLGRVEDKNAYIVREVVDGDNVEIEADRRVYPDGLTHEQVIKILEDLKKMGFKWEGKNE